MDFKKLKSKLLNEKVVEGTGFVKLKKRLDEATFPWDKFTNKPPTWDQRTKAKSAEDNRDYGAIGRQTGDGPDFKNDTSKSAGKKTMKFSELRTHDPEIARDLEGAIKDYEDNTTINIDKNSIEITDYGQDKWLAEFPMGNGYERFYIHPKVANTWTFEEDMDDNLFKDFD